MLIEALSEGKMGVGGCVCVCVGGGGVLWLIAPRSQGVIDFLEYDEDILILKRKLRSKLTELVGTHTLTAFIALGV